MRSLREDERDEIESLGYLIKHINSKRNVEMWKIWDTMQQLDAIGKKYVISNICTEKELAELLDLDDLKEIIIGFMERLAGEIEKNHESS